MSEVERLLHYALAPVEPPGTLTARLEQHLSEVTGAAVDELAEFDQAALRDPRSWARLVTAGVVAGSAGGALILVRARQKHRRQEAHGLRAIQKGMREVASDVQKRLTR
jgi:hypothetical protein